MSRALTRRGALCATAAAAVGLTVGAAPAFAGAGPLHPNDARLIELADAAEDVERRCNAFNAWRRDRPKSARDADDDAFGDICAEFLPIEEEIAETPAVTMAGVLAKARALQVPTCHQCAAADLGNSLADDVWRLFGGGSA